MAARVRVVSNPAGYAAVRKDPAVAAEIERRARAVASAAVANSDGKGEFLVEVDTVGGASLSSGRARAAVFTADGDAMEAEAESRALTRALDAGR